MTPAEQAWHDSGRTDTRGKYAFIKGWEEGRAAGLKEALNCEPDATLAAMDASYWRWRRRIEEKLRWTK